MTNSFALLALLAASIAVASVHARAMPQVAPLMMEVLGGPVMMMRDKREPARAYPPRAMMFTGFYRPARESAGEQASGVYTQGSSVGGGAYLEQPQYLKDGPAPVDEPNISTADAEAAPEQDQQEDQVALEEAHDDDAKPEVHAENTESAGPQEEQEPQAQQPAPPKKKNKRPSPVAVRPSVAEEQDEEEEEEEEDLSEEENPLAQLAPGKGGKGRQRHPILNNYFPVLFSFPRGSVGRAGSGAAGGPPGLIAAIANSYSTGKGGVASSLATAYGGSPTKKQRRPSSAQ